MNEQHLMISRRNYWELASNLFSQRCHDTNQIIVSEDIFSIVKNEIQSADDFFFFDVLTMR